MKKLLFGATILMTLSSHAGTYQLECKTTKLLPENYKDEIDLTFEVVEGTSQGSATVINRLPYEMLFCESSDEASNYEYIDGFCYGTIKISLALSKFAEEETDFFVLENYPNGFVLGKEIPRLSLSLPKTGFIESFQNGTVKVVTEYDVVKAEKNPHDTNIIKTLKYLDRREYECFLLNR
ncbi:MAG: hypothetical protein ACJAS4_003805 [Bacteriovoracaceae bacterium]|jgi:hypothetical protein